MAGVPVLVLVAPLRLTVWILAVAAAAIVVLMAIGISRHLETVEAGRRRERVRAELGPLFSRFLETDDAAHLAEELRPAFLRMDAAHRPVAAMLVTDVRLPSTQTSARAELGIRRWRPEVEPLRSPLSHGGHRDGAGVTRDPAWRTGADSRRLLAGRRRV